MIAAQYQKLTLRVDALQLQERVILLLISIVIVIFLAYSMGFNPLFKKQQLALQDIKAKQYQLELLRARSSILYEESTDQSSNPLTKLHGDLSSFGQELQLRLDSMLSPDKATSILEQVMTHKEGLTLRAVNASRAPLESIGDENSTFADIDEINRYELVLQLEGGYLETLDYLRALEALPWKFFWTGITFAVTDYPMASVDLELYTLGLSSN